MDNPNLVECIQAGEVAVIPTDTLYGIVAVSNNPSAVEKVYRLRNRTPSKPCIILISDIDQLIELGIYPNADQKKIMDKYWPGPVSFVLSMNRDDLDYLHRGTGTLAIRLPDSDVLRSLIRQTGPIIAPSANHEGQQPAQSISEAKSYFGNEVKIYIDNGICTGNPSGLIDMTGIEPVILRPLNNKKDQII